MAQDAKLARSEIGALESEGREERQRSTRSEIEAEYGVKIADWKASVEQGNVAINNRVTGLTKSGIEMMWLDGRRTRQPERSPGTDNGTVRGHTSWRQWSS